MYLKTGDVTGSMKSPAVRVRREFSDTHQEPVNIICFVGVWWTHIYALHVILNGIKRLMDNDGFIDEHYCTSDKILANVVRQITQRDEQNRRKELPANKANGNYCISRAQKPQRGKPRT